MGKAEFIDKLRMALNGKLPAAVVADNIAYYEDYINTEIRKGRSEEEVLTILGDPRLIARTIITATGPSVARSPYTEERDENYREYNDYGQQTDRHWEDDDYGRLRRSIRIHGWAGILLVIVIFGLIISAVFSVLSFLAPVLIPILVVAFLIKLFRDWLN